jgi:hypothetical protein
MPASNEPLEHMDGKMYSTAKGNPDEQRGLPVGHVRAFKVGAGCWRARGLEGEVLSRVGGHPCMGGLQAPMHPPSPATPRLHARPQVRSIPKDMTYGGKGPLLSASDADYDLAWSRAQQAFELCRSHAETLTVRVEGHNAGGLLAPLLGLKAFIPFSAIDKAPGTACVSCWSLQLGCERMDRFRHVCLLCLLGTGMQ